MSQKHDKFCNLTENEDNYFFTPADDTYLTPVDSGAESKSANVSKRKGGLWTGIRSTDTPGGLD